VPELQPVTNPFEAARIASMSAACASDFGNGMGAYVKELPRRSIP
jgi:hypothetical protein